MVANILRKHWGILQSSYPEVQEFGRPPLVSYRRGRTLGSQLVHSDTKEKQVSTQSYMGTKSRGMFPCLTCSQCCCVHKGTTFEHPTTGRKYTLRGYYTCLTKFAVYVLICPCGLLYVGETTLQIKTRISQHRSTIRKGNVMLPVSKHRGGDRELRLKQREVWWINKLNSFHPHGLNKDYDLYLFL
ncbi:hypothetical protein XELAEV_18022991mg [Xenopus laevis]|uniref:GIY-YIG domain-containing protein n=1 Tax=Xenopus laevis TaxID=8355 RepID=A0A974D398_XENLA|nr:hypothetical protein XELAEV_18022991mg [Xenopus laevis]